MTYLERLTVDQASKENIIYDEHMVRYQLVAPLVANKKVVDVACGSGYGSAFLAESGGEVIGIDLSKEAIINARLNYTNKNLEFREGDAGKLDLLDKSVDIITSFETIEHLLEIGTYLQELKRIIKDDGLVFISTPNKEVFKEKNPFHLKEFTKTEFTELLKKYFSFVRIIEQKNALTSFIKTNDLEEGIILMNDNNSETLYFVAICSNREIIENFNNVASVNTTAYERRENNLGWKLVNAVYKVLQKMNIFS
jgi:2-polyprenyl-3-methyl-5-hydroxy-6-metoxy-1,4-benzoquinol methylase